MLKGGLGVSTQKGMPCPNALVMTMECRLPPETDSNMKITKVV